MNHRVSWSILVSALISIYHTSAQSTFNAHYGYADNKTYYLNAGPCLELQGSNFLITGHNNDSAMILINTDDAGSMNWYKLFTTNSPYPTLALSVSSSILIRYEVSSQFTNSRIFTIDQSGNFLWGKSFSNPQGDDVVLWNVIVLNDGNLLAVGRSGRNLIDDTTKMLVVKMDASGNLLWQKLFSINGYIKSRVLNCAELPGGNLIVFGDCNTDFSIGNPEQGFSFAMKLSPGGDFISCNAFNQKHNSFLTNHSFIKKSSSLFLAAGFPGPFSGSGLMFNSIDTNGLAQEEWHYALTFYPNDFALEPSDDLLISGSDDGISGGMNMIRIDSSGSLLWAKKFDPENFYDVISTADGGLFATGYTRYYDGNQTHYSYLTALKTNSAGEGACNSSDSLFPLTKNIDPVFNSPLAVSSFNSEIFTTDFFLNEDTSHLFRYDCTVGIPAVDSKNLSLTLFPNPADKHVQITVNDYARAHRYSVQLYNELGQQAFEMENITDTAMQIDLSQFSPGIYHIVVNEAYNRITSLPLLIER